MINYVNSVISAGRSHTGAFWSRRHCQWWAQYHQFHYLISLTVMKINHSRFWQTTRKVSLNYSFPRLCVLVSSESRRTDWQAIEWLKGATISSATVKMKRQGNQDVSVALVSAPPATHLWQHADCQVSARTWRRQRWQAHTLMPSVDSRTLGS